MKHTTYSFLTSVWNFTPELTFRLLTRLRKDKNRTLDKVLLYQVVGDWNETH